MAVLAYAVNVLNSAVMSPLIALSAKSRTSSSSATTNVRDRCPSEIDSAGGGVLAAMDMAKARSKARAPQEPSELIADEGQATIERWLNPIRALAVAQLSASGDAPVDEKAAHQALVRAHVCAQVSNIESSSVVQKAIREGKKIVVDGWCVGRHQRVTDSAGSTTLRTASWSICTCSCDSP